MAWQKPKERISMEHKRGTRLFHNQTMAISQKWQAAINYNTFLARSTQWMLRMFVSNPIMARVSKLIVFNCNMNFNKLWRKICYVGWKTQKTCPLNVSQHLYNEYYYCLWLSIYWTRDCYKLFTFWTKDYLLSMCLLREQNIIIHHVFTSWTKHYCLWLSSITCLLSKHFHFLNKCCTSTIMLAYRATSMRISSMFLQSTVAVKNCYSQSRS
jgi:hypothetical protein